MKNNEIIRAYGTDYKNMTKALLGEAGLAEDIRRKLSAGHKDVDVRNAQDPDIDADVSFAADAAGHELKTSGIYTQNTIKAMRPQHIRIGIKPNLVSPTPADFGGTTHPEIIAGIIEYLTENGFAPADIEILEGSWVGDKTSDAFEYCGYNTLSDNYGVRLLDMQKESSTVMTYCEGGLELEVCRAAFELDYLINVPVLKGHCQTKMTCALKNIKGLIPNNEKRRFHRLGLHKPIAFLNTILQPDIIVTDHICGDPDFEEGGNPLTRNCIMVSRDPVLTDALACEILGLSAEDVRYLMIAEDLGLGSTSLDKALIRTIEGSAPVEEPEDSVVSGCEDIVNGAYKTGNAAHTNGVCNISSTGNSAFSKNDNAADTYNNADECGESSHSSRGADAHGRKTVQEPRAVIDLACAVEEIDSCSACYGTLLPALERLRREGHFDKLKCRLAGEKIGIGQGYRGQKGHFGVGSCTACFEYSIKGCPPDEAAIYNGLKGWI